MRDLTDILDVYSGSDADRTRALYAELEGLGPAGIIAMNLFRATKASERAKVYRGRGYRSSAYEKKQWSMDNACAALLEHGEGFRWGWGIDPKQEFHRHVLYVELPTGQISFHTSQRGEGPDYPGEWDGQRGQAAARVCLWVRDLLGEEVRAA